MTEITILKKNYNKSDNDNDCYIFWNDSNDFNIQLEKKIWLKYTSPVSSSENKSLSSGGDFVNKSVCFFFFFFLVFLVNSSSRPGGKKRISILFLNHGFIRKLIDWDSMSSLRRDIRAHSANYDCSKWILISFSRSLLVPHDILIYCPNFLVLGMQSGQMNYFKAFILRGFFYNAINITFRSPSIFYIYI